FISLYLHAATGADTNINLWISIVCAISAIVSFLCSLKFHSHVMAGHATLGLFSAVQFGLVNCWIDESWRDSQLPTWLTYHQCSMLLMALLGIVFLHYE